MAKYTETLVEYMRAGGVLPALFEQIDGFAELFVQRFCDYEIGFETPELFTQKLEGAAKRFIPFYKTLIDSQNDLIAKLTTSYNRVHTSTRRAKAGRIRTMPPPISTPPRGRLQRQQSIQPPRQAPAIRLTSLHG